MKSFKFLAILLITLIVLFLIFFYRGNLNEFLGNLRFFNLSFWNRGFDYQSFQELKLENFGLRAKIRELEGLSKNLSPYLTAKVYSRYPFNDQQLIVIAAGSEDGVTSGAPVLIKENFLLGKVKTVNRTQSVVETIFNPEWRSSVVTRNGTKALLRGGQPPALEFISKESALQADEEILNISPEFPLELILGTARGVRPALGEAWLTAELTTAYRPENISQVLVLTQFP